MNSTRVAKYLFSIFLGFALSANSSPASAHGKSKPNLSALSSIASLTGQCLRLKIGGDDASKLCSPRILNESFRNGRTGFTFVAQGTAVVAFSGMGEEQLKTGADRVVQPVDHIIWSENLAKAHPIRLDATGNCTYTNPYKGPASISCVAHTSQGDFEANFLSDGQPPEITDF